ncbi:hypothetical protein [Deinococcus marmoris]|uniref:hypothetical protein n=1 Tax=Deinococcus marmoris TaxID=249408 RepID=UPI0012DD99EA|nr:hypothetical protein [Deinococcus marmoris]
MTPRRTRSRGAHRAARHAVQEGDYTLEVLRGKTSRVKLREHDAEALEGQSQAQEERELTDCATAARASP